MPVVKHAHGRATAPDTKRAMETAAPTKERYSGTDTLRAVTAAERKANGA